MMFIQDLISSFAGNKYLSNLGDHYNLQFQVPSCPYISSILSTEISQILLWKGSFL